MSETEQKELTITSRISGTTHVSWRELKFIQQDNFKEWTVSEKDKLKASLKQNRFAMPFFVWYNGEHYYCLDGKHRTIVLEELEAEGMNVPTTLPALMIDCADEADAARMVLVYSSTYAAVTREGLTEFLNTYDLVLPEVMESISLPHLSFDEQLPIPANLDGELKGKPATMKITFENTTDLEKALKEIDTLLKAKYPTAYISVSSGEI